jgi:ectoine hydroxylase-related dioxygenase (phytanoyl-CoA dioxygenase family)
MAKGLGEWLKTFAPPIYKQCEENFVIRKLSAFEIESAISKIEYLGYAIIPEVLSQQVTRRLLETVQTLFKEATPISANSGVTANQLHDKYVYHLQYKNLDFLNILTDGNLLELLRPFLNDPYYTQLASDQFNFLLSYYNARSSIDPLKLHIDNYIPSGGYHPISMQIVFSLSGQNTQNGATTVVPGSHNIHKYPDRNIQGIEQIIECDPGDVIVWDSRLWHGALENFSHADRWSLVATFRPWWAKQNFDPVRGLSEEMFSRLSPQQKALLGFLSLPPKDEFEKVSLKQGYKDLLNNLNEYRKR